MLLSNKFRDTRIILASKSPRRQFLLRELGIEFDVIDNLDIEEDYPSELSYKDIPVYLALKKSDAFKERLDDKTLLITADTIVWCAKRVLNKPEGRSDAIRILRNLSGRKHKVISGVCIRTNLKTDSFSSVTSVIFKELSEDEIVYYVDRYKPYDKAGAYGIQEWIGYIGVKSIKGSYFNVMGFPVSKLYERLLAF